MRITLPPHFLALPLKDSPRSGRDVASATEWGASWREAPERARMLTESNPPYHFFRKLCGMGRHSTSVMPMASATAVLNVLMPLASASVLLFWMK